MTEPVISGFMRQAIYDEVIPTLALPKDELEAFAGSVFERFRDPFIKHALLSISLNSVSKYRARVLPSIEAYTAMKGRIPPRLTFGLASLIAFYKGTIIRKGALVRHRDGNEYVIRDDRSILKTFAGLWSHFDGTRAGINELTGEVLQFEDRWGRDLRHLPGLSTAVLGYLGSILEEGMKAALARLDPTHS